MPVTINPDVMEGKGLSGCSSGQLASTLQNAESRHPAMQVPTLKSSCAPPRGAPPRVMLSTEGAKANHWRYNQMQAAAGRSRTERLLVTDQPAAPSLTSLHVSVSVPVDNG